MFRMVLRVLKLLQKIVFLWDGLENMLVKLLKYGKENLAHNLHKEQTHSGDADNRS